MGQGIPGTGSGSTLTFLSTTRYQTSYQLCLADTASNYPTKFHRGLQGFHLPSDTGTISNQINIIGPLKLIQCNYNCS